MKLSKSGNEVAKQEMIRLNESRRVLSEKLIEKWNRVDVGSGLLDLAARYPQRARNTAMAIQMQEAHLKQLNETVIATSFSTKPENVLKIVRIGVANSNRGDIFTEYPLVTTDDAIFFIDMTYESALRGSTAGEKIYEKINEYYAGEQVVGTIDATGAATTYTVTLSTAKPIVPYSVRLLVGGAFKGNDNGSNTITSGDTGYLTGTNTINYTTGEVTVTFAAAPNAKIELLYNWNSEDSSLYSSYGTVGINLRKQRFLARPMPLGYSFSSMVELTLGTTMGKSAEELLIGAVGDEHAKARDYKAIARARTVALRNTVEEFDTDFAAAGEISDKLHAQKLLSKVGEIGAVIYDDIKRGVINKAIAGSKALVYMKKHDLWKDDNTQPRTGVYKAGSLSDIDVYACPAQSNLVTNNEVLLTYKNPEEGMDLSLVFGVLTEIKAELTYPQFYKVGNLASVEDCMEVNTSFCRLLQLKNLTF